MSYEEKWYEKYIRDHKSNPNSRMKEKWLDVSYPKILQNKLVWFIWRNALCQFGFHLFDETQSVEDHYLYCDACDFVVHISKNNKKEIGEN